MAPRIANRMRTQTPPADVLATWIDGDYSYILRNILVSVVDTSAPLESQDHVSKDVHLVHEGGSSSAVWAIGKSAFCKVKSWHPSMELEGETIAFVRKHVPQIPVPEVIYSWIDEDRTFLVLKRIQGATLRDAWPSFSSLQHDLILENIASICDLLALKTSAKLQSVSEKSLSERFLAVSKDGFLGPLTLSESLEYFTVLDSDLCPQIGKVFYLYHADLGPGNIMVSKDGSITDILDWEAAGFYPRFWMATKPSIAPGLDFSPLIAGIEEFEWKKRLRLELENREDTLKLQAGTWSEGVLDLKNEYSLLRTDRSFETFPPGPGIEF
ncbi:hypothetical protein ACJ72_00418 [Emergomyces africanus]|uniref:Aminoglycoside phosphotransferase domain-containing protein n=1 Tax=Emergomyces africanus TaxID=1955775 RepID=A0A1B7P879_9EURO|nr:hypothetical protein ACJ72_00418 [Emergomyces africanus]